MLSKNSPKQKSKACQFQQLAWLVKAHFQIIKICHNEKISLNIDTLTHHNNLHSIRLRNIL